MMNEGRQSAFWVRVLVPDGNPTGVRLIEKSNWTGYGLVIPRVLLCAAKTRQELGRPGVYLLAGPTEGSALPQAYVGEGDPVRPRLEQHAKQKDFWTHAVVFTSKDASLNKAHVQHLEARLVGLARQSKRCVLENGNVPQLPSLSHADEAEVEGFLTNLLLCLPILGYGFFEPAPTTASIAVGGPMTTNQEQGPPEACRYRQAEESLARIGNAHLATSLPQSALPELQLDVMGRQARGLKSSEGFAVLNGAPAIKEAHRSLEPYYQHIRAELVRLGIFVDRGEYYELTADYLFVSPAMAAGVLLGRSANGRLAWRTADGRTLKSLLDAEASE
jgi:hypothetical protein